MTFRLDQISRSAEGREIRRAKEVPGDRLTVGRSPTSDVHLTDLAVALDHVVLQRVAPMRLNVAAEEGLGVELNGRKVSAGTIELGTGGELRIASHLLRILPTAADSDTVSIEVERVGESAKDELARVDTARFSLVSVMPGKRITAYALIALVLGIFLVWPIWVYSERPAADHAAIVEAQRKGETTPRPAGFQPDTMWSSGSLSQVHHNLEGQCSACHVKAFEPVRDEACLSCHTNVHNHGDREREPREAMARYLQSQPDLTGWARFQLAVAERFGHSPGRCVDCHTEHEGPQEMPRTAQRFCSDCHADLKSRLPDTDIANASTFGHQQSGAQAHPEFRPLVLIDWEGERPRLARVPMERSPVENSNLKFPHELHLRPGGGVSLMTRRLRGRYGGAQQLTCSECHTPTPDGARYQPVDMEEDCAACHTLTFDVAGGVNRTLRHGAPDQVVADLRDFYRGRMPARPPELGAVARRRPGDINQVRTAVTYARARAGAGSAATQAIQAVFRPGGACYDCHVIEQRGPLDFHVRPVAFPSRYLLNGWFDHRAHLNVDLPGVGRFAGDAACLTCHTGDRQEGGGFRMTSNRAADLLIPGLASCQQCHGGEGDRSSAVPSGCAMCHDYHMDEGAPVMILRQRVRGQRWESTVMPVASLRGR